MRYSDQIAEILKSQQPDATIRRRNSRAWRYCWSTKSGHLRSAWATPAGYEILERPSGHIRHYQASTITADCWNGCAAHSIPGRHGCPCGLYYFENFAAHFAHWDPRGFPWRTDPRSVLTMIEPIGTPVRAPGEYSPDGTPTMRVRSLDIIAALVTDQDRADRIHHHYGIPVYAAPFTPQACAAIERRHR